MLGLLRRKAQSPFIQATVLIIALVFIFWGVGTNNQGGDNSIATVNEEPITYQQYQKAYNRTVNQLSEQFGGSLPKGLLESMNIKDQVINQLINGVLLRQAAVEMGLLVSKGEIADAIREMEAFRTNGIFDRSQYEAILSASRMTPAIFEESMRADLLSAKTLGHIERFAKTIPSAVRERLKFENEEINIEYVVFNPESYKDSVEVTDEALHAYYEENKGKYRTDPQIRLKYLSFPFDEIKETDISDEKIQQYYQQNIQSYIVPEKRAARHILIKAEEGEGAEKLAEKRQRAEDILAKVKEEGADFAELAKEFSEGPSAPSGGYIGFFGRGRMVPPFENAVFAMQEGDVSEVVQTRFGFHIIKLDKIEPERVKPVDEVKEEIVEAISKQEAGAAAWKAANKAYEDIILAGSLDNYAAQGGATVNETDFFERRTPSPGSPFLRDAAFLDAAFSLKKGELSSLVETSVGYAIIYAVDSKESEIAPFEMVQEDVKKDFINSRSRELAAEAAEALLATVASEQAADEAAWVAELEKSDYFKLQETGFVSRSNAGEVASEKQIPVAVINKGFELSVEKPYPDAPVLSGSKSYVFRYKESRDVDEAVLAEKEAEFTDQMLEKEKAALVNAWVESLKRQAEITVKREYL
jgi:peptidyl-prolyl cis-trans isomerase D